MSGRVPETFAQVPETFARDRMRGRGRPNAQPTRERHSVPGSAEKGSVLMLVLFVCLAVAVVVQALSTAVLCAERATVDETVGRARLEEKDQGLLALRQRALLSWAVLPWTVVRGGDAAVEGTLFELEDSAEWIVRAETKQQPNVSRLTTSAWVERGRDGIDLPLAALVAGSISAETERDLPWIEIDPSQAASGGPSTSGAVAYLEELPAQPLLGDGCSVARLSRAWRLDPGWLRLDSRADMEAVVAALAAGPAAAEGTGQEGETVFAAKVASAAGLAPTPQVAVLTASRGRTVDIPEELGLGAPGAPVLVVVRGGAALDARDLGDLYGVLVVDDGSLLLDGTTVHGALFVTETLHLGAAGRLLFSRPILRWATDRSLVRARLVPGTRWEDAE